MPVTSTPIFAQAPYMACVSFITTSATTSRAPVAVGSIPATMLPLTAVSTNGLRIDSIQVNACGTSQTTANGTNVVGIWVSDATNVYLLVEIPTTSVTPTAATAAFTTTYTFVNPLVLPSTFRLYATVGTTVSATGTALQVCAMGGSY
jgi:hypothetical protein